MTDKRVYRKANCANCGEHKFIAAKGLCRACYTRFQKYGDPAHYEKVQGICSIEGCNQPHVAKGYCEKHYKRFLRHGYVEQTRRDDWGARESHPLYSTWASLRRRKKGIGVCEEWRKDFWAFYESVGDRPSLNHFLVLKDEKGNYEPNNVEWKERIIPIKTTPDQRKQKAIRQKMYRASEPDRFRNYEFKRRFGINLDDYNKLLREQWGRCAICGKEETTIHPNHGTGKPQRLAIDHNHETGKIRGLLCVRCNQAIGSLSTPDLLRKAAKYLEERGF